MTETPSTYQKLAVRLGVAAAIGVVVGLVVLALEHAVDDILKELFEAPVWVPAAVVGIGAVVTAIGRVAMAATRLVTGSRSVSPNQIE